MDESFSDKQLEAFKDLENGSNASSRASVDTSQRAKAPASFSHIGSSKNRVHPLFISNVSTIEEEPSLQAAPSTGATRLRRSLSMSSQKVVEKAKEYTFPLDRFAVEPRAPSLKGSVLSILVFAATGVYLVFLILKYLDAAPNNFNTLAPSLRSGPFVTEFQCKARSGCLLYNGITPKFTDGAATRANEVLPIQKCIPVSYGTSIQVPLVYSLDPTESLVLMWDPTTSATDEGTYEGYGFLMASMTRCSNFVQQRCDHDVDSQIGPGRGGVFYARVVNNTRDSPGVTRHEFLPHIETKELGREAAPCSPDPTWKEMARAHLRLDFYIYDTVWSHESFWLYLWGSAGGAFGSFLEVALLVCFLWEIFFHFYGKQRAERHLNYVKESFRRIGSKSERASPPPQPQPV